MRRYSNKRQGVTLLRNYFKFRSPLCGGAKRGGECYIHLEEDSIDNDAEKLQDIYPSRGKNYMTMLMKDRKAKLNRAGRGGYIL